MQSWYICRYTIFAQVVHSHQGEKAHLLNFFWKFFKEIFEIFLKKKFYKNSISADIPKFNVKLIGNRNNAVFINWYICSMASPICNARVE